MRLEVHKFGGTSVGDPGAIERLVAIVDAARADTRLVVVVSAMGGTTDLLVEACEDACSGGERTAELVASLSRRHERARKELVPEEGACPDSRALYDELAALLSGTALVGELTPAVRDRVLSCGEKLSARLVAASLTRAGVAAEALDADTFLETDAVHGEASPLAGVADRTIAARLTPLIEAGVVPVVTGFCGLGPTGATTTLGRGGSDLSATILARAVEADEVVIWTDVRGVFEVDPRIEPAARPLAHLNYREASELSFYGAKVLYQRSMIPAVAAGIPILVKSSFEPEERGTRVDGRVETGRHPVKAVAAIRDHALLTLAGKGMAGLPGVAARLFGALAERAISVTMISQASSESSITLALSGSAVNDAERAVKRAFRDELSRGDVDEVLVTPGVALVAAVGLGMAHRPGVAAEVCRALGEAGVNILGIAQGSSELNMTLAVAAGEADRAVRALYGSVLADEPEESVPDLRAAAGGPPPTRDLVLLGAGAIGRRLLTLVDGAGNEGGGHPARSRSRWRVLAVADSGGFLLEPGGMEREQVARIAEYKEAGGRLRDLPGGVASTAPVDVVRAALEAGAERPVLIDVSDADGAALAFAEALGSGCDVVTANKKPLADDPEGYRAIRRALAPGAGSLRAEATVGAGLPVIETLETLLAAGDRVVRIQGCLSGTLGFLMTRLEAGEAFSKAVAEAMALGYTEPDPVADLSGADVGRKAMILGRWSGLMDAAGHLELEGLVDSSLSGASHEDLQKTLEERYDEDLAGKVARADREGRALRYVATVEAGRARVGLEAVPRESPLGRLTGTDNMIVIETDRYADRPLVIAGPGAGIDVTAMAVFGDLLRL